MTKDLTVGSVAKRLLFFTIPLCAALILQQLYGLVDSMIVGKVLGVEQLAGVGTSGSLSYISTYFAFGAASGFAVPLARTFGAKDYSGMRRYLYNGILLCVLFAVVMTAFTTTLCRQMLGWIHTPEDVMPYAYQYLIVIYLGIPFTLMYNFLASTARALGDSKTPLIFLAVSAFLNIGMDLLFLTVFHMDVIGAALATVIAQALSGIMCLVYIIRRFPILRMSKEERTFRGDLSVELLKQAFPMGFSFCLIGLGFIVIQNAINSFGANAIAGVVVALKIEALITAPLDCFGQSVTPFIAQNMGAGRWDRIRRSATAATIFGTIWSIVSVVILWFCGRFFIRMFLSAPNPEVVEYAFSYLFWGAVFYILHTILVVYRAAMLGMGYSGISFLAGGLEMVARCSVGIIFAGIFGFIAICLATPLAWLISDIMLIPMFYAGYRKKSQAALADSHA